jgi:Concanavalin A-like lectin/glucanases superfamily
VTPLRSLPVLSVMLLASCGSGPSTAGLGDGGDAGGGTAAATLRTGLAGAWTFDVDGRDHSGNALDLGVTGLRFATGKFGKGLQLAGEGTPIAQRPIDDPSLNLSTGDFTVSFWIDFAMTASAQFVAIKGYNSGGWFVGWAKTAWAYSLIAPQGGGTFIPPGGSPTPGTFIHVVFERTGNTVEIFVDSSSVGTATVADSPAPAASPFQVGGYAPGGVTVAMGQSVVDGVVDDLAIWHRALTSDERAYLATHAVP